MEVLNKKERFNSFLLFLVLFLMTMTIVLIGVYFDFQVPRKEIAMLKLENEQMRSEFQFQERFAEKLEEVKKYTDKLNEENEDFYYNQQIANKSIVEMQKMIPENDSLAGNNMYDNITLAYRELVEANRQIKETGDNSEHVREMEQEIKEYERDVKRLTRDLEVCRMITRPNQ